MTLLPGRAIRPAPDGAAALELRALLQGGVTDAVVVAALVSSPARPG